MKRWFIVLAALALLLIPSVALGEDSVCDQCATPMQKVSVSTLNEYYHTITWKCINASCVDYGKTSTETVPHSWRAANCIEPAKCSECGEISADEDAGIDPNNHVNYTITGILNSPEFDEFGCHGVEGHCNDCNKEFVTEEPHTLGTWQPIEGGKQHKRSCICIVSETEDHYGGGATCTTQGKCTACGALYYGGHNWGAWTKSDDNQHVRTCQNSGCNQKQYGNHSVKEAATCMTSALCAVCNGYYGSTNPSNHDLESHGAQAASCTKVGWDAYQTCKRTGCTYSTYSEIPALKHAWDGVWKDSGDGKQHYQTCKNDSGHRDYADHTETTAATCTAAAYCADCKSSYGSTDPNAHDLESHDAQAASCTEVGWDAYQTCKRCTYSTYSEISALKHDREQHDAQAPTCTTVGWNAYETCKRKGCDYTTYSEIPALKHAWDGVWKDSGDGKQHYQTCKNDSSHRDYAAHKQTTAATCTTKAYCADCKSYYGSTDPNAHALVNHTAKAPTCTTIGWSAYQTCSRCNYSTYVEKSALGHALVNHTAKAPTCTAIGWSAYQTCSRCDYTTYVEKKALGHALVNHAAKAPTCTTIGWNAYDTCSRCDYSTYVEKSALGHALVNHTAKAPTCTAIGWSAYDTCSRCDYSTYVEKKALGHDPVNHAAKAPTCTTIGWNAYDTCSRCDYTTYVEKKALGHDLVNHAAKAPTCTTVGWNAYQTCSRCDYSTYVEKSALGHALVNHAAKAPTCTAIGWNAYDTCSRCDYSTYVEKSALGHALVNHAAKAPTCTTIGWNAYDTCSRCDYTTYNEKKALGHSLVNHAAQAPTCTTIGWNSYISCKRCDYTTYSEKKPLGHSLTSHAAQAPTCTTIGWNSYVTCKRCDYTTYSEKKPLGHSLTSHAAQAPTCTTIGWNSYISCKRCDYTTYQELPALGHLYGEWNSNADGTDTSSCVRGCGSRKTVVRTNITAILPTTKANAAEITLSPVSGEVSDGTKLALVEDATAEAVNKRQPAGEAIVRMGELESGDTLLSVAFENDGELTPPSGQVNISLPAELLDGHSLALILEDGTETPLDFEVEEDTASFVLDFSDSLSPACLIRLVPLA